MSKKIIVNPFPEAFPYEYRCFGCSPLNNIGLALSFYEIDDVLYAEWEPNKLYEGYKDVLHGGIQATILDEISAWLVNTQCNTAGVTQALSIEYYHPVKLSGIIKAKAVLIERTEKQAKIAASLMNSEGKVCSEAIVTYFLYPEAVAKRKLHYPGKDAFYLKEEL